MKKKLFSGLGTALVTPFFEDGRIDMACLSRLVCRQLDAGIDFLVPCGTTGESPTLSHDEQIEIIHLVVKLVDGRVPVLAGTGSNSTKEAVDLTNQARIVGADGALVVFPYYNRPEDSGVLDYYRQVAEVGLPICLYDIPGRAGRGISLDVIFQLIDDGAISSLKWASGDHDQLMNVLCGSNVDFSVLSGNDQSTFELMALGGDGVISVVSNIAPCKMVEYFNYFREGNFISARKEHFALLKLMRAMFIETNPQPVKTALSFMGLADDNFRSPMMKMDALSKSKLFQVISESDLFI